MTASAAPGCGPTQKRESTDERRKAIAAAARELIVEKGFEGLRTRDIAERVGINIATLHYHVPSKQALIELVTHSLKEEFAAQHLARPRDGKSATARLEAELADYKELLFDKPDIFQVFTELAMRAKRDPAIADVMTRLRARWRQHYVDILGDGRDSGEFRADLDPEAAAVMIVGALVGSRNHQWPDKAAFDAFLAEILRAVRNPASPETTGNR